MITIHCWLRMTGVELGLSTAPPPPLPRVKTVALFFTVKYVREASPSVFTM